MQGQRVKLSVIWTYPASERCTSWLYFYGVQ